jgi:hypothetical protein
MADLTAARDAYLRAAGHTSLGELVSDYAFVRAGDLASLAFCNNWTDVDPDGCGYAMRLQGTPLSFLPTRWSRDHTSRVDRDNPQKLVDAAPVVIICGRIAQPQRVASVAKCGRV